MPELTEHKTYEANAYRAKYKAIHEAEVAKRDRALRATLAKADKRERNAERADRRADRGKRAKRGADGKHRGWDLCTAVACNDAQTAEIDGIRAAFKNDTANQRASMRELHRAIARRPTRTPSAACGRSSLPCKRPSGPKPLRCTRP